MTATHRFCSSFNSYFLKVSPLRKEEVPPLRDTLMQWKISAEQMERQAIHQKEKAIFHDLSSVAESANEFIRDHFEEKMIFTCSSTWHPSTIQGVSIVIKEPPEKLWIRSIITNPHNVRSHLNHGNIHKVEGAGSALIHNVFKRCVRENYQVTELRAHKSAEDFYKKKGLTLINPGAFYPEFTISSQEIVKLLKNTN